MSEILYNFGANHASIGDVQGALNGIQEARADIDNVFKALMTVYEGQGAQALDAAHAKLSAMLDDAVNNAANTQRSAADQQEAMQAMDRANASAF
ncbi:hypothetical protein [Mycobacterium sp. AZCC_0083]|uniref:hypothetical protein n=1 Tax=Mycobacterium sp. AZCC_0083 TaxID=2735882 RepID=UPI00161A48AC|nr:hypothetical protein [Mycobacterium sp. AZCC_0083]MBB5167579.1 uncharacterized protein YukE [Mycobacterium sp. AZCC_0083]